MSILIVLIFFIFSVVTLTPKVKIWIPHHRCKYCHSWFCLKVLRFNPDTVVTGHDQSGLFGGLFKTLKIFGLFGGTSYVKDNPFLREFGTYDYICTKCGKISIVSGHRDRR